MAIQAFSSTHLLPSSPPSSSFSRSPLLLSSLFTHTHNAAPSIPSPSPSPLPNTLPSSALSFMSLHFLSHSSPLRVSHSHSTAAPDLHSPAKAANAISLTAFHSSTSHNACQDMKRSSGRCLVPLPAARVSHSGILWNASSDMRRKEQRFIGRAAKVYTVEMEHDGETHVLKVAEDETMLSKALDAGLDVPYDCQLGVCMTCPAKLEQGQVDQSGGMLSEDVKEKGYALMCSSYPRSDCRIRSIPEDELLSLQLVTASD